MKIDVCIVTKTDYPPNLENVKRHVPFNNIIIEQTEPIAIARMNAIKKVQTEFFLFIDDDVVLLENWIPGALNQMLNKPEIGAIHGRQIPYGFGKDVFNYLKIHYWEKTIEQKKGERGYTDNVLLRTESVRDWIPVRRDLVSWEDYDICQHVLRKGLKWLSQPVKAYHLRTWRKLFKNAVWNGKGWKQLFFQDHRAYSSQIVKYAVWCLRLIFDRIQLKYEIEKIRLLWFIMYFGYLVGLVV